jgi:hypothetical protein
LFLFAVLCAWPAIDALVQDEPIFVSLWFELPLLATAGCAVALACGLRWVRIPLRVMTVLWILLWSVSWGAQHAIDRTVWFWAVWAAVEALLVYVFWSTSRRHFLVPVSATVADRSEAGRRES